MDEYEQTNLDFSKICSFWAIKCIEFLKKNVIKWRKMKFVKYKMWMKWSGTGNWHFS